MNSTVQKMSFTRIKFTKLNILPYCLLFTFWINPVFSGDDPYLDALEAEAASSDQVQKKTDAASPETNEEKLTDNNKTEFESRLKNQLPATFKTYKMLSEENKKIVVNSYFDNNRSMPTATRKLFELYFKKP